MLLLALNSLNAFSGNDTPIALRDQMLRSIKNFNPATTLPGYTENPAEVTLQPDENTNRLSNVGRQRVEQNNEAKEIYQQAEQSHVVTPNMNTSEMQLGGALIENAELPPGGLACGSGQCDSSATEISDDINEGLIRLGSLAGSADEVSSKKARSKRPTIFVGQSLECEKYILGIRDCCTGGGWGDWIVHCPSHLKALQKAKAENRVYYLGSYRKHKLDLEKKHVYCVFPSKLAGIVQLQGRFAQLHVAFGEPKYPNCRGITPEELARINFKSLNLSALTQDFKGRMVVPNASQQGRNNQSHVERLNRAGRAHD